VIVHQADTERSRITPAGWLRRCGISRARRGAPNWLRYGIQPKNARPGLAPGRCKGKAHDADHLGYAGRRGAGLPQVVRQDAGRPPRRPQGLLLRTLGVSATDPVPVRLGTLSRRATRTIWTTPGGCCTLSLTAPDGKRP
jgi:hypothetical protein